MNTESLLAAMNRHCGDLTAVRTLHAMVCSSVRRPSNVKTVGLVVGMVLLLAVAPIAVVGATGTGAGAVGPAGTGTVGADWAGAVGADWPDWAAGVDPGTSGVTNDLQEESGADFNVTITNTSSPVTAGETLRITVNVTNEGESADTQEIDIAIGDAVESTQKRTLAASETDQLTLEWEPSAGDTGEYVTTAESDETEDSVVTVVERVDADGSGGLDRGIRALIVLLVITLLALVAGSAYQYHQSRTESR